MARCSIQLVSGMLPATAGPVWHAGLWWLCRTLEPESVSQWMDWAAHIGSRHFARLSGRIWTGLHEVRHIRDLTQYRKILISIANHGSNFG